MESFAKSLYEIIHFCMDLMAISVISVKILTLHVYHLNRKFISNDFIGWIMEYVSMYREKYSWLDQANP